MLNGRNIEFSEELAAKIVKMRQKGHTWRQIDAELFPGLTHRDTRCGSFAGDFCVKHRKKHPEVEEAFSKAVIGGFTATQIHISLRKFGPRQAAPKLSEVPAADVLEALGV